MSRRFGATLAAISFTAVSAPVATNEYRKRSYWNYLSKLDNLTEDTFNTLDRLFIISYTPKSDSSKYDPNKIAFAKELADQCRKTDLKIYFNRPHNLTRESAELSDYTLTTYCGHRKYVLTAEQFNEYISLQSPSNSQVKNQDNIYNEDLEKTVESSYILKSLSCARNLILNYWTKNDEVKNKIIEAAKDEIKKIKEWSEPASLDDEIERKYVRSVSYATVNHVAKDLMDQNKTVWLQYYEDTCTLCFLYRPILNSVQKVLNKYELPLNIIRLNVSTNDFPPGAPVSRSTPVFMEYDGVIWHKLDAFRPSEVIEAVVQKVNASDEIKAELNTIANDASIRFRQTMDCSMWRAKRDGIFSLVFGREKLPDADLFSNILSQDMVIDMKLDDDLKESIARLSLASVETEAQATQAAIMLGNKILSLES